MPCSLFSDQNQSRNSNGNFALMYHLQQQAYSSVSIKSSLCKAKRKLECSLRFTYKTIQFVLEYRLEDCLKNIFMYREWAVQYQLVVWKSYLVSLQMYLKKSCLQFLREKTRKRKYFRMGSRSHSIPCRSPSNLKIHNMRPWCHSPYHTGSYSHPPSHPHSNSSRTPMCRCHRMLVPEQCYRGWEIHRTSKPGYSEHSNLHVSSRTSHIKEKRKNKKNH